MSAPDGQFRVVRHWSRWSIEDVLDWHRQQPVFDTEAEAAAEADRRNRAEADRRRPRPARPRQEVLFDGPADDAA